MGASIRLLSRRVHWGACQFGIALERCGTEDGERRRPGQRRGPPLLDIAKRRPACPSALCQMSWKTLGGGGSRYFIARLPNWRQISGAPPLGRSVAKREVQFVFISAWAIDAAMTA